MKTVLFIYGTRPEAIKVAPLIKECQKHPELFRVVICVTGQHREMLDQINEFFGIKADFDLNLMTPSQTLADITVRCLVGLKPVLEQCQPNLVVVQGDTTTVLASALAAFYQKIPVAHLEAGLRSGDKLSPFPEEVNRRVASHISDYHFAPTPEAVCNLEREGITKNVYKVGNTVIDALLLGLELIKSHGEQKYIDSFSFVDFSKKIILVTAHRRESFGEGFENICSAIASVAREHNDIQIVFPMHLNPNVREPIQRILGGVSNVSLIEPLGYSALIWLMEKSFLVLTDSGGIQEEAPSLGKPVLVLREVTERKEGVDAGTAKLVGTKYESIVREMNILLTSPDEYLRMAHSVNPYGDGTSSRQIVDILCEILN